MGNEVAEREREARPSLVAANRTGMLIPKTMEDAFRLAQAVARTAGGNSEDERDQALVKILAGAEIGIPPIQSVRTIYAIPRPQSEGGGVGFTLAAELMRAMVMRSEVCAYFELETAGEVAQPETLACTIKAGRIFERKGREPRVIEYVHTARYGDFAQVMQGKHGIKANWRRHPLDMVVARCTSIICKRGFADVTNGMEAREVLNDEWEDARDVVPEAEATVVSPAMEQITGPEGGDASAAAAAKERPADERKADPADDADDAEEVEETAAAEAERERGEEAQAATAERANNRDPDDWGGM